MKRKDIVKALKGSSITAAGPSWTPYFAWRAMGEAAVDVLGAAMEDLQRETVEDTVQQAFHDEPSCSLNYGLVCCVPKKTERH